MCIKVADHATSCARGGKAGVSVKIEAPVTFEIAEKSEFLVDG